MTRFVTITWLFVTIFLFISQGCVTGKPKLLMYDDGQMDDKRIVKGNGHAIKFTVPDENWGIKSIRFYGKRESLGQGMSNRIVATICDADLQPIYETSLLQGYLDTQTEKWRNIDVTPPLYHPGVVWVIIDTGSTMQDGIYMGIDSNVTESHSAVGEPGGPLIDLDTVFDWMVRLELTELPPAAPESPAGE